MAEESLALELLTGGNWGEDQRLVDDFLLSPACGLLREALGELRRDELYMSHVHGVGHIERTMVHGAMGAWAEHLGEADSRLLLTMCAYHDTGRTCDFLDGAHGARSAEKLASLTGLEGEDLKIAMAGVEAHSVGDPLMEGILQKYAPADLPRARLLAQHLKDADGLDRVRIHDLNTDYLRRPASRERGRFAQAFFDRYVSLEKARGIGRDAEGYDLPTIQRMKAFVTRTLGEGKCCSELAMLAWESLGGQRPEGAKTPPEGETCAILRAAQSWLGARMAARGTEEEARQACRDLEARFLRQYGSLRCADLKPLGGCGGFSVDVILFSWQILREGEK